MTGTPNADVSPIDGAEIVCPAGGANSSVTLPPGGLEYGDLNIKVTEPPGGTEYGIVKEPL
jgi:hypothetical protein